MRAVLQERFGSPETLSVREVPDPAPGEHEVLVRVRAASVNARDWHAMRGDPYLARLMAPEIGLRRPAVPIRGTDFAGEVVALGPGVSDFRVGDEVFGEADGAFAEYVRAPQDRVEHRPAGLSFEQAAALPLAGNTALMLVRDGAAVRPGQRVLINGASGGVGLFTVGLASTSGAEVTGVCSPRNTTLVEQAGAAHVVEYTRMDFTRTGTRYDSIIDLVANRSLADLRRALTPTGTLVLSGGGVSRGGSLVGPMGLAIRGMIASRFVRRQRIVVLTAVPSRDNLAVLRNFAESGRLVPVIDRTFALDEAAAAIRYLETEHARAKVVLTVG
jgi:NADPH:quinone reductase-like Zn-dependent oxidoreductase